jgi:hypothetical protein
MLTQVASMMPSDEAEAPLEYQKGSIGAIADRYMHSNIFTETGFAHQIADCRGIGLPKDGAEDDVGDC